MLLKDLRLRFIVVMVTIVVVMVTNVVTMITIVVTMVNRRIVIFVVILRTVECSVDLCTALLVVAVFTGHLVVDQRGEFHLTVLRYWSLRFPNNERFKKME